MMLHKGELSPAISVDDGLLGGEICALCAIEGDCCCATDRSLGHLSFPLSAPEWRRILPFSDLATEKMPEKDAVIHVHCPDDFSPDLDAAPPKGGDAVCEPWPNSPDFLASMRSLFPGEKNRIDTLFPKKARHFSLRLRKDGSCVFLGPQGCRLPRAVRPWYCLIFPAWVTRGEFTLFVSEGCLIAQRAANPMHGMRLMRETPDNVRQLHAALRRDWGLD